MNSKIALSALAFAVALGGASSVMAAGKKHNVAAHEAYAAASGQVTDPRANKGSNHEGWCDINPQCNGWDAWLQDVNAGKLQSH